MPTENTPPRSPLGRSDPDRSFDATNPGGRRDPRAAAPRGRRRRPVLRSLLVVGLAGLVLVAGLVAWGVRRLSDITHVDVPGVEPAAAGTANNWLLVGTDGREGIDPDAPDAGAFLGEQVVGKRTDTIMLARVDSANRTIDLLSIPRDLWVPIAGRDGSGRINGAYNGDDGRPRLVATLSQALDVEINHYAEVNFVGFLEIVDALEGVPLWFEYPTRDVGSGLDIVEQGCHIVDGSQALAYARSRTYEELVDGQWRVDPTGDLGRTTRQRTFLSRTIDTATATVAVTSLGKLNETMAAGGRNLLVEDGASVGDLVSLARTFAAVGGDRIVGHALPVEDFRTEGGARVLRLREAEAKPVLDLFRVGIAPASPEGTTDPTDPQDAAEPDGAGEQTDASDPDAAPPESVVKEVQVFDPPVPGYGRFGFAVGPTPEGTPCA